MFRGGRLKDPILQHFYLLEYGGKRSAQVKICLNVQSIKAWRMKAHNLKCSASAKQYAPPSLTPVSQAPSSWLWWSSSHSSCLAELAGMPNQSPCQNIHRPERPGGWVCVRLQLALLCCITFPSNGGSPAPGLQASIQEGYKNLCWHCCLLDHAAFCLA